jgi:hypothetical protein
MLAVSESGLTVSWFSPKLAKRLSVLEIVSACEAAKLPALAVLALAVNVPDGTAPLAVVMPVPGAKIGGPVTVNAADPLPVSVPSMLPLLPVWPRSTSGLAPGVTLVSVTEPLGAASPTRAARPMLVPENCGTARVKT